MNVTYSRVWVCCWHAIIWRIHCINNYASHYEGVWRIHVYKCVVDTQSFDAFTASIIMHHTIPMTVTRTIDEFDVFTCMIVSSTRSYGQHLIYLSYESSWLTLWMTLTYSRVGVCRWHAVMAVIWFIHYVFHHDSHCEWLWLRLIHVYECGVNTQSWPSSDSFTM